MTSAQQRLLIAIAGSLLIAGYAAFGAVNILVLEPLAAVPGATLTQIDAELAAGGETLGAPSVIGAAVLASLVGLLFAVVAVRGRWSPTLVAETFLVLLVFGAPAYFVISFGSGMSLGDVYEIRSEQHSPWGGILLLLSGVALLALAALAITSSVRSDGSLNHEDARR